MEVLPTAETEQDRKKDIHFNQLVHLYSICYESLRKLFYQPLLFPSFEFLGVSEMEFPWMFVETGCLFAWWGSNVYSFISTKHND